MKTINLTRKLTKFLLIIFLTSITTTPTTSICMDSIFNFVPYQQPLDNLELSIKRKQIMETDMAPESMLSIFPTSTLIKTEKPGARPGVCSNCAMRDTLNLNTQQFQILERSILGCEDWFYIIGMPHLFFDQKIDPTPGDLAIYFTKSNIEHFGEVKKITAENVIRIKSKIGISDFTYEHDVWNLPEHFGNRVYFWQLKQKYTTTEGKNLLFEEIKNIIANSIDMQQQLNLYQQAFLMIAEGITPTCIMPGSPARQAYVLLKKYMGLNINYQNENGETALMLASKRKDLELVRVYKQHNADDTNVRNKDGLSAQDIVYVMKLRDEEELAAITAALEKLQQETTNS